MLLQMIAIFVILLSRIWKNIADKLHTSVQFLFVGTITTSKANRFYGMKIF